MNTRHTLSGLAAIGAGSCLLLLAACGGEVPTVKPKAEEPSSQPSNRIATPSAVRRNLGITFAKAEYRAVTATIAVPGHFIPQPLADVQYAAPEAGRVRMKVSPLQTVAAGDLLLELDTPAWPALQQELHAAGADALHAAASLAEAQARRDAAGSAGDGAIFAATVRSAEADAAAAASRQQQLLLQAANLSGISVQELTAVTDGSPAWTRLERIPLRAQAPGTVREVSVADGAWVDAGAELLHIIDATKLVFRGQALQSDLFDRLREGQKARIRVPEGSGHGRRVAPLEGTVRLGVSGDAGKRVVDVFIDLATAGWARPDLAAIAEIGVAGGGEEVAVPRRAIIQDGLKHVFFRRDPKDPDTVIRTEADLGATDGSYIAIRSGLGDGEEVVIDGVYQLKLASSTSGQSTKAGHFHSDGTWHDGDH